jgi:hypothetical protein
MRSWFWIKKAWDVGAGTAKSAVLATVTASRTSRDRRITAIGTPRSTWRFTTPDRSNYCSVSPGSSQILQIQQIRMQLVTAPDIFAVALSNTAVADRCFELHTGNKTTDACNGKRAANRPPIVLL